MTQPWAGSQLPGRHGPSAGHTAAPPAAQVPVRAHAALAGFPRARVAVVARPPGRDDADSCLADSRLDAGVVASTRLAVVQPHEDAPAGLRVAGARAVAGVALARLDLLGDAAAQLAVVPQRAGVAVVAQVVVDAVHQLPGDAGVVGAGVAIVGIGHGGRHARASLAGVADGAGGRVRVAPRAVGRCGVEAAAQAPLAGAGVGRAGVPVVAARRSLPDAHLARRRAVLADARLARARAPAAPRVARGPHTPGRADERLGGLVAQAAQAWVGGHAGVRIPAPLPSTGGASAVRARGGVTPYVRAVGVGHIGRAGITPGARTAPGSRPAPGSRGVRRAGSEADAQQ